MTTSIRTWIPLLLLLAACFAPKEDPTEMGGQEGEALDIDADADGDADADVDTGIFTIDPDTGIEDDTGTGAGSGTVVGPGTKLEH